MKTVFGFYSCIFLADAIVELANWDSSKARDKLHRDIDAHVASVRAAKLSELTSSYEVWKLTYLFHINYAICHVC